MKPPGNADTLLANRFRVNTITLALAFNTSEMGGRLAEDIRTSRTPMKHAIAETRRRRQIQGKMQSGPRLLRRAFKGKALSGKMGHRLLTRAPNVLEKRCCSVTAQCSPCAISRIDQRLSLCRGKRSVIDVTRHLINEVIQLVAGHICLPIVYGTQGGV